MRKRMFYQFLIAVCLIVSFLLPHSVYAANTQPRKSPSEQRTIYRWLEHEIFKFQIESTWQQVPTFSGQDGLSAISPQDGSLIEVINVLPDQVYSIQQMDQLLTLAELGANYKRPMDCLYRDILNYADSTIVGRSLVWSGCAEGMQIAILAVSDTAGAGWSATVIAVSQDEEWKSFTSHALQSLTIVEASDSTYALTLADLNIRSGPGTRYGRIGSVPRGTEVIVTGQAFNCGWLRIALNDGSNGWIAGGKYVRFTQGSCQSTPNV